MNFYIERINQEAHGGVGLGHITKASFVKIEVPIPPIPIQKQIIARLEKLSENPELAKPLSNVFKNYRSERIGKYRIVFSIKQDTLIIAKIEHRKNVYK